MNIEFLKNKKGLALTVFIIVIILVVFWGFKRQPAENPSAGQISTEQGQPTTTSAGQGAATPSSPGQKTTTTAKPKSTATFIVAPGRGETWLLGKIHTIRWSHEAGRNGAIILIDASSKTIVGWISPSVSAQQVSYDWDTTYVSLSRNDPTRKNILAGTYIVKIVFDNSALAIESAPFGLISSGAETILTRNVLIQSSLFTPNSFSVKQGSRVAIINNDAQTHAIKLGGIIIATLAPQDAYVFDTTGAAAIAYEFRMLENQLAKLTVTVEK